MRKLNTLCRMMPVLLFLLLLSWLNPAKASHGMGANITWTCTGNGRYVVTLQFFRDCGGVLPFTSYPLSYSSASCGVNASITLNQVGSAVDITPVCSTQPSNCNGGSGPFGVEQWTFTGILQLPVGCGNDWQLGWTECCRNAAITTLNGPGNQNIFVNATLNNTLTPCNDSPVFNNPPTPVVCLNQPVTYSHGVTDPNSDSLVFSLVNCLQASGTSVVYNGGFSGTVPLTTASGVTINSQTGVITFTPTALQIGVMCVRVDEYRGGILIGRTVRDMQFRVINCTNNPPAVTGINGTGVYTMTTCVGSNFCFNFNGSDPNSNNVLLSWNNGIPGGTMNFTGNNTTAPVGTFCWTPTLADVGFNSFTITARDNACPINGVSNYSFIVNVVGTANTVNAGIDRTICSGSSVGLLATSSGATSYSWSPSAGLSCTNCANPTANPLVTTVYTVTATFPDGCTITDNVQVTVIPLPVVSVSPGVAYTCPGAAVTLTANAIGATGYVWNTGPTVASITVSPASTTTYTVTATGVGGCTASASATVNVNAPTGTTCNVIYASPTGSGTGTQASPASLATAIGMASCNGAVIKMAIGTYTVNNPINTIAGNLTLEGGFDPAFSWRKTSLPGATTITRSNLNPEGVAPAQRLVAMYLNGATNVRLQDLTITTANGTGTGMSTYGIHMTSCSSYDFVRVQVLPGAAAAGANGTTVGTNGTAGAAGTIGGSGSCDGNYSCCFGSESAPGGNGGAGGTGSVAIAGGASNSNTSPLNPGTSGTGRNGGGGGAGGKGGGFSGGNAAVNGNSGGGSASAGLNTSVGIAGGQGDPGGDGTNGAAGAAGATGAAGVGGAAGSVVGNFWVPGPAGGTGLDGAGGQGGAGGGGGGRQTCATCDDGPGNGGAGGGGGGQGGTGGSGGFGGGSSYGIFLALNGAAGSIDDSRIVAGAAGAGGNGAAGGTGGAGGAGGPRNTTCTSEVGEGGAGGTGGAGGAGGVGGAGATGQSINVNLFSGTPLVLNDNAFNLPGQPTIFMTNIACTNTNITYSTAAAATWDLGAGASPQLFAAATSATTVYTTTGRKNIINAANTYTGFANIVQGSGVVPAFTTTAPFISGNFHVCAGSPVSFTATNPGINYIYSWDMGGGSVPNTYVGTTFNVVTNAIFNTPGTYTISLNYTTDCCGLSANTTLTLIVDPQPVVTVAGPTAFCANTGASVNLTASGANTYTWSPSSGLNTTSGANVIAYPTSTTTYTVTGVNTTGNCFAASNVTVTVRDVLLAPSAVQATCNNNGQATVIASGGSGSYGYSWLPLPGGTPTITGLIPGNYPVTVTDLVTGCISSTVVNVPAGPGLLTPAVSNVNQVLCNGGATGNATITVTGGVGPAFFYNWTPSGGTGATSTNLPAGTYAVTVFDAGNPGCPQTIPVTITQPNPILGSVLGTSNATCPFPNNNGSATVNANGGVGPYTYNWGFGTGATQSGLAAGTYNVTATDTRGCTVIIPVNIICILPVEYASLTATPVNKDIALDWETTTELNNLRFDVLRSVDGVFFTKVGEVAPTAAPGQGARYNFMDRNVQPNKVYYYQLQQFDLDGNSSRSNIVNAMVVADAKQVMMNVFPNPFEDVVNIDLRLPKDAQVRVEIANLAGQAIGVDRDYTFKAGNQTVALNLKNLSTGMYFAKVYVDGRLVGTSKIVKAK